MTVFILILMFIVCLYSAFVDFADAKDTSSIIWASMAFASGVLLLSRILP